MTKTSKLISIFLIYSVCVVACAPVTYPNATSTSETKVLPTIKPDPTSTILPTPSSIILDLNSASKLFPPTYKQECVNTLPFNKKTLNDFSAKGIAVFTNSTGNLDSQIILYDLKSGEKQIIPNNSVIARPTVSPDHRLLFYTKTTENSSTFVLSDSNGESLKTYPASIVEDKVYYLNAYDWLGNDSLRILGKKDYQGENLIVLLLDPLTGKITQLSDEFNGLQPPLVKSNGLNANGSPNQEYLDWGIDPFNEVILFLLNGANVVYSPDKKLIFYPHQDNYAVLYDVNDQKELTHVIIPQWGELPEWSPDGNYISFITTLPNTSPDSAKKDFYLLSKDGKNIQRLTYLSEQFERVSIKEYSWSPDNTKIAFWLNTKFPSIKDEVVPYELAVVDVTNGNITNYCFPYYSDEVQALAQQAGLLPKPVWSPDSSQLLIPSRTPAKNPTALHSYDVRTILFDPVKLSAMEIMDSIQVDGWMTNKQ